MIRSPMNYEVDYFDNENRYQRDSVIDLLNNNYDVSPVGVRLNNNQREESLLKDTVYIPDVVIGTQKTDDIIRDLPKAADTNNAVTNNAATNNATQMQTLGGSAQAFIKSERNKNKTNEIDVIETIKENKVVIGLGIVAAIFIIKSL